MKNRNFFSFSWPLIRECFRIYWCIPALSFVLYFFAGIFPILSNLKRIPELEYYFVEAMSNLKIAYMLLLVLVPVIAASLMMGFMHNRSKALLLHTMPLSKDRLFNSYYVSGLTICLVPVVLMAILYCFIAPGTEVIQFKDICGWFLGSAAVITFFYGVAVLAGSLTGTVYMNLIVTGILMFIVPLVMYIIKTYCQLFIVGFYKLPDSLVDFCINTNPVFSLLYYQEPLSAKMYVIYFIAGVLIAMASKEIYRTRKLELIGSSVLSGFFEKVCTYLAAFVGMSAFGLLAWNFTQQRVFIIIGMILGSLFALIITKIVMNRTMKIFNRSLLRSIIIYVCIAVVFVSITIFDVFGIENRVPDTEEIESVEMLNIVEGYDYSSRVYGDAGKEYANLRPELSSEESIELVRRLHEYIVENEIFVTDGENFGSSNLETPVTDARGKEEYVYNEHINIRYNLKNGSRLERIYNIAIDDEVADILDAITTCSEYTEKNKITSYIDTDKISYMTITPMSMLYYDAADSESAMETIVIDDKKKILDILNAWDEDVAKGSYRNGNRSITAYTELAMVDIYFTKTKDETERKGKKKAEDKYSAGAQTPYVEFMLTDMDENLLACLVEQGYYTDWHETYID